MLFFVNIRAETVIRVDGLASTIEKLTRAMAQAAANSATVLADTPESETRPEFRAEGKGRSKR